MKSFTTCNYILVRQFTKNKSDNQNNMDSISELNQKQIVQELEYSMPSHWLLRRAYKERYSCISKIVANLISRYLPNGNILDIGCGDGKGTSDLYDILGHQYHFTGVDYSQKALMFARAFNMEKNIEFIHGAAKKNKDKLKDRLFDIILYRDVLEHLDETELISSLEDSHRRLTKNGIIVATVPSINTPVHPKHYRHYSKELLIKHFIENGFTVKKILGYMYQPRWLWRPLSAVSELPV